MEELIPITLFIVTGGVILLRPITKRLGDLLEALTLERRRGQDTVETGRLRETVAALENRIALLEERQNFTESLLTSGNHRPSVGTQVSNESRVRELLP